MLSVFLVFYNFCRIHMNLKKAPTIEAGLPDHVWSV
jgi:hypothetical protein